MMPHFVRKLSVQNWKIATPTRLFSLPEGLADQKLVLCSSVEGAECDWLYAARMRDGKKSELQGSVSGNFDQIRQY